MSDAELAAFRDAHACVVRCEWALLCARARRQEAAVAAREAGHTLAELGGEVGLTAERVRQIAVRPVEPGPEP